MCCAIKPIASWLLEEVVSVCRERCGGQGYLSCNRFGTFLGLAHAAMTAEGDNSVLMQKVAKEHLGWLSKNPPTMIKANSTSLSDPTYLHSLLQKVCIDRVLECLMLRQLLHSEVHSHACYHSAFNWPELSTFQREIKLFTTLGKKMAAAGNLFAVNHWIELCLKGSSIFREGWHLLLLDV